MINFQKVYTVDDVRLAGYNLEPLKCKLCGSLEVTFHRCVNDGYCAECGQWQNGEVIKE